MPVSAVMTGDNVDVPVDLMIAQMPEGHQPFRKRRWTRTNPKKRCARELIREALEDVVRNSRTHRGHHRRDGPAPGSSRRQPH